MEMVCEVVRADQRRGQGTLRAGYAQRRLPRAVGIGREEMVFEAQLPRRHTVELVGRSHRDRRTESLTTYDPATGIETTVTRTDGQTPVVTRSLHGILLSTETTGETTFNSYDAFGHIAATSRSIGEAALSPLQSFTYAPSGDLLAKHTYTNGTEIITETYAYDLLGNRIATTDALGNTTYRTYDPFGRVLAEWGATYPVRYTYDTAGRRTSLSTTRDGVTWDTTTWTYDHATGNRLSKTYADGSTVLYTYTPDNLLLRTTYASGRWEENVYDERRQVGGVMYSDDEVVSLAHDEFGNETSSSNGVSSVVSHRSDQGDSTNETAVVSGGPAGVPAADETLTISRTFDSHRRLTGIDGTIYEYNVDGLLASISNDIAIVEYAYTPDRFDAGYSLTLLNGVMFTRSIIRDGYRRSLVTGISSAANGVGVGSLAYTYDALNRPTSRNNDTFGYNARGEVVFSRRGAENAEESYSYDGIGNLLLSTLNSATNTYTANNLNQYVSILRDSAPSALFAGEIISAYDLDGNMTQCGDWTYTYDAANRLKTVSSNGVLRVTNFYDAKSRRVKKVTPEATTTFFYDDWNLREERIACANGTASTIRYYWGKDLSGTLQGAGGVGGLLYLMVDSAVYVPFYDNNGNITRYLDANGSTVAQYIYDAFGNLISKSGPLADFLRHRFSTKYYDAETGFYYYGYRFYHPPNRRWLNRDPIEEGGGMNLYIFCGNNAIINYDGNGCAYFAKRELAGVGWWPGLSRNPLFNALDVEVSHEHLFYGTPSKPLDDIGYFKDGGVRNDRDRNKYRYVVTDDGYDDCVMREAVARVKPKPYCTVGFVPGHDNCQTYASLLRSKYNELINDPKIQCKCFGKRNRSPITIVR